MKVLFVCDGNICRSPLAAEYLRHRAVREGLSHLVVDSAGLLGIENQKAAPYSIEVAHEAGLDLKRHRSRGVTAADLQTADLVVAMTRAHLSELARRFPDPGQRRILLRAFEAAPTPREVAPELSDPFGGPIEGYGLVFAIIRVCVDHLVLHLRHAP